MNLSIVLFHLIEETVQNNQRFTVTSANPPSALTPWGGTTVFGGLWTQNKYQDFNVLFRAITAKAPTKYDTAFR